MFYWAYDGSIDSMGLAVSSDLYNWTKKGEYLQRHTGDNDAGVTANCGILDGDILKMWYLTDNATGYDLHYATIDVANYGSDMPNIAPLDDAYCIDINGQDYITFENIQISGGVTSNALIDGTNIIFRYCDSYGSNGGHGFNITGNTNQVYYSRITGNLNDGIQVSGTGCAIYNNVIYNSLVDGLDADESCIFRNNIVRNSTGSDINIAADKTVTGGYNCIEDAAKAGDGTYTDTGTSTLFATDPLMTDPANGDFTLQPGSPCRERGTNVALTADYDGSYVPQGLVDIGAYEYPGSGALFFGCNF